MVFLIGRHTNEGISTHILTKRMTKREANIAELEENFNSHPHEEDDNGSND